jgi:hypothetical protein
MGIPPSNGRLPFVPGIPRTSSPFRSPISDCSTPAFMRTNPTFASRTSVGDRVYVAPPEKL